MNKILLDMARGFTLLEVLVAVAILAILVALAAPNFDGTIKRNRVLSEQRDLVKDLAYARSEAVKQNTFVGICSSTDGESCAGEDDWSEGWIIFVDNDTAGTAVVGDSLKSTGEEVLRSYQSKLDNVLTVSSGNQRLRSLNFSSRGYMNALRPASGGAIDPSRSQFVFCSADGDENVARAVFVEVTGRAFESRDNDNSGVHDIASSPTVDISC